MELRLAQTADSPLLRNLYAQYTDTAVTFEYLPAAEEFTRRIADTLISYPFLVCEDAGRAVGYTYAHRQMERAAYGWNAVLSVYVDQRFTSRGIGTRLYSALLALLQLQGVVNVYGGVTLPNEKSERLHEKMGFRLLGVYHKTGYKCGSWHDVAWFEKRLCTLPESPAPFLPFSCLPKENVLRILRTQDQL